MAIRNAASCSYIDVNDAVNGTGPKFSSPAGDGDQVIVPAGTQPWSSSLVINSAIELIGQTTITNLTAGTAADSTIIQRNLTSQGPLIKVPTIAGKGPYRISGFTFQGISATPSTNGYIDVSGQSTQTRIDHCHFDFPTNPQEGQIIRISGGVRGVTDNSVFHLKQCQVFYLSNGCGPNENVGHAAWAQPTAWGTSDFYYVEDNYIHSDFLGSGACDISDGSAGLKVVFRHNHVYNFDIANHGTEGNARGGRAMEVSYNDFHIDPAHRGIGGVRSGGVLFHNNTWNANNSPGFVLNCYRYTGTWKGQLLVGWEGASGRSPWDVNDTEGNGSYVEGHTPWQYYPANARTLTGTATAGNVGPRVTDSTHVIAVPTPSPAWTTDKWKGYGLYKFDDGYHNLIISTTFGDELTVSDNSFLSGHVMTWASGSPFQIYRCLVALDQSSRGQGDLVTGKSADFFLNSVTGTRAWPHQVLDPSYSWSNRLDSASHINLHSGPYFSFMFADRDFYNEAPAAPPSGQQTTGVAVGTFANRPATGQGGTDLANVTANPPGTAYWATDKASVNGSADLGALYVWRGSAWVLWYQPYTYPHPLTGSGVAVPTITSTNVASFTEGVGGTFQATSTGFSSAPTWSHSGGTFPASGTSLSGAGLLTVGAGSAAGIYAFTLTATNGGEVDSQSFTLTITAAPTRVIALSGSLGFGNVDINTSSQKNLTITNNGNVVLTVTNITFPAGFVANQTSFTVAPGASHLVNVTFSPTTPGAYSGTATVVSDKTSGTNTMAVSGFGANRVMALSGSLAFGSVTTGQTATRQLTIINNGNVLMSVAAVAYPQGFSGDFTSGTIGAGGSKIINVTFSPLAAQVYSGNVDIQSDKTSGISTIAISGTGVATATKIIQLTGDLNFGSVQTGMTVNRTLTITNGGDTTLNVSGITYPTGFTGAFAGTVAPGASHDVTVTFAPVAAISYSGTVTVASDATDGINTATASGTGVAPATMIVGLSGGLDFGNVQTGATSTRVLTIANTGSAPLSVSGITYPSGFTGAYSGAIAPGATQDVIVTFAPTLVQGYGGTVTVASNATSGTNTTSASGAGVTAQTKIIGVSGNLVFGNVQKNHSIQKIITILNTGTNTLSVTNITCPTGFSVNLTTATIAPGASQNVTVTFKPIAAQSYGGNITIASDKTSGVNTIACSGNGTNKRQVPFILIVG